MGAAKRRGGMDVRIEESKAKEVLQQMEKLRKHQQAEAIEYLYDTMLSKRQLKRKYESRAAASMFFRIGNRFASDIGLNRRGYYQL
jgi:hypothetical protein